MSTSYLPSPAFTCMDGTYSNVGRKHVLTFSFSPSLGLPENPRTGVVTIIKMCQDFTLDGKIITKSPFTRWRCLPFILTHPLYLSLSLTYLCSLCHSLSNSLLAFVWVSFSLPVFAVEIVLEPLFKLMCQCVCLSRGFSLCLYLIVPVHSVVSIQGVSVCVHVCCLFLHSHAYLSVPFPSVCE